MRNADAGGSGFNVPLLMAVVVLVTVAIGAAATRQGLGRSTAVTDAYGSYVGACSASVDVAVCNQRVDSDGDACFRASFASSNKRTPPSLDTARFKACVDVGHAAWHAEQSGRGRQQRSGAQTTTTTATTTTTTTTTATTATTTPSTTPPKTTD
jgi:hypothetical protein